jgi:cystathionine beta-synthase
LTKFLSKEWCVENKFLSYDELKDENHPYNGIKLDELKLPEIQAYGEELTVNQAKDLFANGANIIAFKKDEKIWGVTFAKKFLELVCLKKLKGEDSALKTKTAEFAVLPN